MNTDKNLEIRLKMKAGMQNAAETNGILTVHTVKISENRQGKRVEIESRNWK